MTVVNAMDIVIEPGLAKVVDSDFEHNDMNLRRGDEVYVLSDWEIDYSHAWVNETEVGLPIRNPSYFNVVLEPRIEHWVLVRTKAAPTVLWWLKLDDAPFDTRTTETCRRPAGF